MPLCVLVQRKRRASKKIALGVFMSFLFSDQFQFTKYDPPTEQASHP
jgi:uncharacterized protein YggL (DUF469 family)